MGVERQQNCLAGADDGHCVRFAVQCEATFDAKIALQHDATSGRIVVDLVFAISIQVYVHTVCNRISILVSLMSQKHAQFDNNKKFPKKMKI